METSTEEKKYEGIKHDRKKELMSMRYDLTVKLINLRDKVSDKRFNEKLKLFSIKR